MLGLQRIAASALLLTACGPAIPVDGPDLMMTTGEQAGDTAVEPTAAPDPTMPMTTGAPATTGSSACSAGVAQSCACPDGSSGVQECASEGVWEPCQCGSGSSGGGPHVPELPPGETCLPLEVPCEGSFELSSDEDLAVMATCSRVDGSILITQDVTTLESLSCLRTVEGNVSIIQSQLMDLAGLDLVSVDFFGVGDNPALVLLDAPQLEHARVLTILGNPSLSAVDLSGLEPGLEQLDVLDNDLLPDCAVMQLQTMTQPEQFFCAGNLMDACTEQCVSGG